MLDIKWIINNIDEYKSNLKNKGLDEKLISESIEPMLELYGTSRVLQEKLQFMQHERHLNSEKTKSAKNDYEKEQIINNGKELNSAIYTIEMELQDQKSKLDNILAQLPNMLQDNVPIGSSEDDNLEIEKYDILEKSFHYKSIVPTHIINTNNKPILDHVDILKNFGMIELERTVNMSGARFLTLMGRAAKLERALASLMLDVNLSSGFTEYSPPYMITDKAMYKAGHLPKFEEDSFKTTTGHRLIPTAEVSLSNLFADKILSENDLPIRMTAHTPCFRSEAGSAGRDTKGLIRLHQFSKVELVTICKPEDSETEHQLILNTAKKILQMLDLPYRVVLLCSADTGLCSSKTYDIEVWFPSQGKYREISSCSNYKDYSSRRLMSRYKKHDTGKNILTHILNGSSLPIGRTLAAIVENYMDYDDDNVRIPTALIPYFGNDKLVH